MMTIQEIHTGYENIIKHLDKRELKSAFDAIKKFTPDVFSDLFLNRLNKLQELYQQMLHYYAEGQKDPMRKEIYNELLSSAYELADEIREKIHMAKAVLLYYRVRISFAQMRMTVTNLSEDIRLYVEEEKEILPAAYIEEVFKTVWTAERFSEEEIKTLRNTLSQDKDVAEYMTVLNCQIVSALTLGLLESFDKIRMGLLFDAEKSKDEEVRIRAHIGIMIVLYLYRHRIECYPDIILRLDSLSEVEVHRKTSFLILKRFILSRETEKITNRIKDEIIPEIMKMNPKFNPYKSLKDLSPEKIEEDMNPEWLEKLSDSKLGRSLEEFNKLQEEGADVMHSTFIHLKGFPFFKEITHWFIPFSKNNPLLKEYIEGNEIPIDLDSLNIITDAGLMCNSDLYSLYFSIAQIPEQGRKVMTSQLESQLSEVKQQRMANLQTRDDKTERIIGKYVQDLYRFFKLFSRRNEFRDIFALKLDFHNLPFLAAHFSEKEVLRDIAEYYLHRRYFEDALAIYKRLSGDAENDEMMYQKSGYCKQMTGDYEGALQDYGKAELMNTESKWLMRRMAQCYRMVKKPEKAIDYYLSYEKKEPDNLPILLSIGSCYLEMKNYREAMKYYFKADYMDSGSHKAWRPIAWCSFLTGKYDQARNYYNKILAHQPDLHDYLNAGHTEWVMQNINGALKFYTLSVQQVGGDYEKFKTEFKKDIPDLTSAGIHVDDIALMLDKVSYSH